MSGLSRTGFAFDLLRRLHMPVTKENVSAIVAWERAEGGHFHNDAHYNPLNTTQPRPGDHAINGNSAGVRAYSSYESGLRATEQTLRNGRYGPVLRALRSGRSAERVAHAVVASPWGTGSLISACLPAARAEVAKAWRHHHADHSDGHHHEVGHGQHGSREAKVRDVVRVATSQLGYHERGDNLTKYGAWYGLNGQPWCGMFVSWVFAKAGHPLPHLQGDKGDGVHRVFHSRNEGSMFGFGRVL
jgi:hypothetical protein